MKNVPKLRFKDDNGRDFPAWRDTPLEKLASVERGKFTVRPRNDPKYFGGKTPFIQTGDIVASGLYLKKYSQTLNEDGLKVSKLFPVNTILITIAANIGDTTITSFDVACTDSVVAIQPLKNIAVPVWIKYSLDTKKEELDSKATQNAQKNINLQVLKPLIFSTPCFKEQTKIADFLTAIDDRISQLSQKCDGLAQYKKGVMQKIFSQELRFKDENGRAFPAWEEKRLGDVSSFFSGGTPLTTNRTFYDGNIPFIKSGEINSSSTAQFITESGLNNSSAKIVMAGDLLYALYGATSGEVAISKINGAINQAVLCIRSEIDTYFLYSYLFFEKQSILEKYLQGGQGNLSADIIKSLKIPTPSKPEQEKVAGFLSAVDEKINQAQAQLDALKQYKQGLLQQMFV